MSFQLVPVRRMEARSERSTGYWSLWPTISEGWRAAGPTLLAPTTPVKMQIGGKNGRPRPRRMWSYVRDERPWAVPRPHPGAWYQFQRGSQRRPPAAHIKGYKTGIVQATGSPASTGLFRRGHRQQSRPAIGACRRKFVDVFETRRLHTSPGETSKPHRAPHGREKRRRATSRPTNASPATDAGRPIFDELGDLAEAAAAENIGKTSLAEAIRYALGRMPKARTYPGKRPARTGQQHLRAIQSEPLTFGRKNYLFMGSEGGAVAAAIALHPLSRPPA